jgi:hypothetical protein
VNTRHSSGVKISVGPSGFLASRMAITRSLPSLETPGMIAISILESSSPLPYQDERQVAPVRSMGPCLPGQVDAERADGAPALSMLAARQDPRQPVDSDPPLRILGSSGRANLAEAW